MRGLAQPTLAASILWSSCLAGAASAQDLAVVDQLVSDVLLFDRNSGKPKGSYGDPVSGPGPITNSLERLVFHPTTGNLFLTNGFNGIQEFDSETGKLVGTFGETADFLSRPLGMAFHPTTHVLYVVDNFNQNGSGDVRRFDGDTGALIDDSENPSFGDTQEILSSPIDLIFQPDGGELLVSGNNPIEGSPGVWRFDAATGEYLGPFGDTVPQGVSGSLAIDPTTGDVFVAYGAGSEVRRYTSAGTLVGDPKAPGFGETKDKIQAPGPMIFHPETHNLLVVDTLSNNVREFDGASGAFSGVFVQTAFLDGPTDLAFVIEGSISPPTATPDRTPATGTPIASPTRTYTPQATPTASPTRTVRNLDFGDAPDGSDDGGAPPPSYPTLEQNNGARHAVIEDLFLGERIDRENDGQPNRSATGDDEDDELDDEDGVDLPVSLEVGETADIQVVASRNGKIDAWIDFNRDGDWEDAGEQIFVSRDVTMGLNELQFLVPANAGRGRTFARFRLSSAGGLSYDGPASDGEVEDYVVSLSADPCVGDCGDDGQVSVSDLITALNIALQLQSLDSCESVDLDGNDEITIDEVLFAVRSAISGCP